MNKNPQFAADKTVTQFKTLWFRNGIPLMNHHCVKSKILKRIYVTETINLLDVVHIGYESTETNLSNPERELSPKQADGTFSVIKNLKIFSNITRLKKIKFARETK